MVLTLDGLDEVLRFLCDAEKVAQEVILHASNIEERVRFRQLRDALQNAHRECRIARCAFQSALDAQKVRGVA